MIDKLSISIWGRVFELPVNYNCYEGETVTEEQRAAICQIMRKFNILTIDELNEKLDEIIQMYQENDKQNHNRHIASLLRYKEYLNK